MEKDILIKKQEFSLDLIEKLIPLSQDWIDEDISYGIVKNSVDDFLDKDIYVAYCNDMVIGYLLARSTIEEKGNSIIKKGSKVYYIEELYVSKKYRSQNIGKGLFNLAQQYARDNSINYIDLITSDKDYKRIFNFYIEQLGMEFFSANLIKELKGEWEYVF